MLGKIQQILKYTLTSNGIIPFFTKDNNAQEHAYKICNSLGIKPYFISNSRDFLNDNNINIFHINITDYIKKNDYQNDFLNDLFNQINQNTHIISSVDSIFFHKKKYITVEKLLHNTNIIIGSLDDFISLINTYYIDFIKNDTSEFDLVIEKIIEYNINNQKILYNYFDSEKNLAKEENLANFPIVHKYSLKILQKIASIQDKTIVCVDYQNDSIYIYGKSFFEKITCKNLKLISKINSSGIFFLSSIISCFIFVSKYSFIETILMGVLYWQSMCDFANILYEKELENLIISISNYELMHLPNVNNEIFVTNVYINFLYLSTSLVINSKILKNNIEKFELFI